MTLGPSPKDSSRMRLVRQKGTAPEEAIARRLTERGRDHVLDHRIADERSRPDIAFPERHVALYVDGCFWHGCPEHFTVPKSRTSWWIAKIAANRHRDWAAVHRLQARGWLVIRAWAHDDPDSIVDKIELALCAR
jgi:DNA mismatch endonuclease (patch repair protein)